MRQLPAVARAPCYDTAARPPPMPAACCWGVARARTKPGSWCCAARHTTEACPPAWVRARRLHGVVVARGARAESPCASNDVHAWDQVRLGRGVARSCCWVQAWRADCRPVTVGVGHWHGTVGVDVHTCKLLGLRLGQLWT
jgi:hypothetical protein